MVQVELNRALNARFIVHLILELVAGIWDQLLSKVQF